MRNSIARGKLFSFFFGSLLLLCCPHAQGQLVIIANSRVSANEISRSDFRDLFSGAWSSLKGTPVTPVLLKDGPVHEDMLAHYMEKSDSAFRATWRSVVFSGQGAMPRSVASEADMVDYVAHTAGAVGYISKTSPHDGVKVLAVR